MRSSKSRSRGSKNRSNNRPSGGSIINRVFDSSGPDGKVRGTPQQIIEKYNQLHRDSQLSNDRVNAENFAQHAEHYTRMLAEAQKEVDRARDEQEAQNRERQAERDRERNERLKSQEDSAAGGQQGNQQQGNANDDQGGDAPRDDRRDRDQSGDQDSESGLVETPEAKSGDGPAPKARKPRAPRKPRPKPGGDTPSEAAE